MTVSSVTTSKGRRRTRVATEHGVYGEATASEKFEHAEDHYSGQGTPSIPNPLRDRDLKSWEAPRLSRRTKRPPWSESQSEKSGLALRPV